METNSVDVLGAGIADALGNTLNDAIAGAQSALETSGSLGDVQSALSSILLMFVGLAALFYVGRWLYKAFKRGAA